MRSALLSRTENDKDKDPRGLARRVAQRMTNEGRSRRDHDLAGLGALEGSPCDG